MRSASISSARVKLICICAARPCTVGDRAHVGVARAVRVLVRRGGERADHRQHHQRRHLLLGLDGADQVILRDVRNFVREDGGQFVLAARHRDQAGVDADETAGQGKRVDLACRARRRT